MKPVSLYVSYGTATNPVGAEAGQDGQTGLSSSNQPLAPEDGSNLEVGVRWDALGGALSTTASLFRGRLTDARISDGSGNTINAGTQRVQGAEIDIAGHLTPRWDVFGGWTYLDSTIVDGGRSNLDVGKRFPYTARHAVTLWSTYQMTSRLKAGGGLTYTSRRYTAADNSTWVPGFARLDAVADYQLRNNIDLQLNVQNLTDVRYYDKIYVNYLAIAAGRSATVQMTFKL